MKKTVNTIDYSDDIAVRTALYASKLTNQELFILTSWMEGYTQREIIFMTGLKISQPAIAKRIKNLIARVKRA